MLNPLKEMCVLFAYKVKTSFGSLEEDDFLSFTGSLWP